MRGVLILLLMVVLVACSSPSPPIATQSPLPDTPTQIRIPGNLRTTLTTQLSQGSVGDKLYTPNQVKRDTVWTYPPGTTVYELVSPTGEVYMMQSYSQIADPNLTIADLDRLGQRLKLPEGWKYQTQTLSEQVDLKTDGLAYVVNGDLYNSYQRRDK